MMLTLGASLRKTGDTRSRYFLTICEERNFTRAAFPLTHADRKERIARIQQSIAKLSGLINRM
jgi:hypothetical protein